VLTSVTPGMRPLAIPGVARPPDAYAELLRVALVPVFVALAHAFPWDAWRAWVAGAIVAVLDVLGAPVARLGPVLFDFDGSLYQVVVSCTALDAFFGTIPLIWRWQRPMRSVVELACLLVVCSVVNLFRLVLGFVLYWGGVPWIFAHEVMAGVFYFAWFLWIARRRSWIGA
jgi:hypothetical protein